MYTNTGISTPNPLETLDPAYLICIHLICHRPALPKTAQQASPIQQGPGHPQVRWYLIIPSSVPITVLIIIVPHVRCPEGSQGAAKQKRTVMYAPVHSHTSPESSPPPPPGLKSCKSHTIPRYTSSPSKTHRALQWLLKPPLPLVAFHPCQPG